MREIDALRKLLKDQHWEGKEFYSQALEVYEEAERQFVVLCGGNCGGLEEYCLSEVKRWVSERKSR